METEASLRCPLCLKQFHQPRLLDQCMHSFCNVCLCSYIRPLLSADNATKKLPCPVCQTIFQGPSSSTELVNWVEQLPIDSLLNNPLDNNSGEKPRNCEPCSVRGKQTKARKICKECSEKLCEQCADVHMSFKGTRTHTLADMDGDDGFVFDIQPLPICEYHDKKEVEYYCKDHNELICSRCAVLKHRVCGIVEIDEATESLSKICSVEKIQSNFLSLKADLEDADTNIQEKNEQFQTEVRDAMLNIEDKRKKVNAAFDRLKENITMQIKKQLNHAKEVKMDRERIAMGIENSLALLNTAEKKGNYIQMFLRSKAMTRQIDGTRQHIKDCKAKYSSARFEYSFSPNVTAIINNMSALGTFSVRVAEANASVGASIGADSNPAFCSDHTEYIERNNTVKSANSKQVETIQGGSLKILEVGTLGTVKPKSENETRERTKIGIWGVATDSKKTEEMNTKTAVVSTKATVSQKVKKMSDKTINVGPWGLSVQPKAQTKVRVKTSKTIEIVLPDGSVPFFAGAAYLDDDRLLMTDVKNHRLLLFDRDLNYITKMDLKRQPRKVTAINKEKIAVGFNKDTLVLIIKVGTKSMTISKRIYTRSPSKCVVSSNNRLFLSSYETVLEDEWHMTCFRLENEEEIDLDVQRVYDGAHMAMFNKDNKNFIVHSCRNDDSVKCHTDDGKEVFSYKLIGPGGVDVDRYGNIFVASICRHKIVHLSPAGVLVKTLETGYLSKPYEVRMNLAHDKLLVTQFESSKVHILELAYQ